MITGRGIGHLLLTAIVYLVLAYSGFAPLAFLLPLLVLLPLLSAGLLLLAARRLAISQRIEPAALERGSRPRLTITLVQHGWLSHGEIDLVTTAPGPGIRRTHQRRPMSLLAGTSRTFTQDLDGSHRGRYRAGVSSARSRDILGLFRLPVLSRRHCRRNLQEFIILPSSEPSAYFGDLTAYLADWRHKQNPDIGDEIDAVANIRSQRPGDSMKRTHWKLSARLDETMIKEFENPIRQSGLLLIDMARPLREQQRQSACLDLADACTDRAAYLTRLLLDDGNALRLVHYQHDGRRELDLDDPCGLRQAQIYLADLDWCDSWSAEQALLEETSPDKNVCFIILLTTRMDKLTVSRLLELRHNGRPVWVVLLAGASADDAAQREAMRMLTAHGLPLTVLDDRGEGEEASE